MEELIKNRRSYQKSNWPNMVALDVTTLCNLKCVHCFNDSGSNAPFKDTKADVKLDIARQVAELHPYNVCMCGGETLCCSNLLDIISILKPHVAMVSMVSNGFFMTREKAKELKNSGIKLAQISIDGHEAFIHDSFRGVDGSFEKAKNAVRYLHEAGISQVDLSMVPHKLNYKYFDKYMAMAYDLNIHEVRVMPFLPSGRGKSVGNRLILDKNEYFEFSRILEKMKYKYFGKVGILWGDPIDHMRRMPRNYDLGFNAYCIEVKTNGDLTVSTYIPVVVGNCTKHSLKEYWEGGYKYIWGNRKFLQYPEKIRNIYDLETFEPEPFSGETINMDILEER